MIWKKRLWGIQQSSPLSRPMLIGLTWHVTDRMFYDAEPSRALLFTTRTAARKYCRAQHALYADRTDSCADWRFVPVRVCETVRMMK